MFPFFGNDTNNPFQRDPFEDLHRMMSSGSMMMDPFQMMRRHEPSRGMMVQQQQQQGMMMPMDPFSQMQQNMNAMFSNMNGMPAMQMQSMMPGASFSSSSSFVSFGSGENGEPHVIEKRSTTRVGPNGVKQTSKSLRDSATGENKISVGRHIGDKAHMKGKSQNTKTGEAEESQEFINIEEDEAEKFNEEFEHQMSRSGRGHHHHRLHYHPGMTERHRPYYNHRPAAIEYHEQGQHSRNSRQGNQSTNKHKNDQKQQK